MDHDLVKAMVTTGEASQDPTPIPGISPSGRQAAYVIRKTSWIFFDEWI
jgi:hypothetical protein